MFQNSGEAQVDQEFMAPDPGGAGGGGGIQLKMDELQSAFRRLSAKSWGSGTTVNPEGSGQACRVVVPPGDKWDWKRPVWTGWREEKRLV